MAHDREFVMKSLTFKCKKCGAKGSAFLSCDTPFIHAPWYVDSKGLNHGFLYCRSCGAVYDTIGSLLGPIKMIIGQIPSKIVASYDFFTFRKVMRISGYGILAELHPVVLESMADDGRLADVDDSLIGKEPSEELLKEYLDDEDPIIRGLAAEALAAKALEPL